MSRRAALGGGLVPVAGAFVALAGVLATVGFASDAASTRAGLRPGVESSEPTMDSSEPAIESAEQATEADPAEAVSWVVVSVRMDAEIDGTSGGARVDLRYVLTGSAIDAPLPLDRPVRVTLLGFDDAIASEFRVDGGPPVRLEPTRGTHRAATFAVPSSSVSDGRAEVALSYRVERAVRTDGPSARARIPVLAGPTAPAAGPDGGFEARLRLPEGWRPLEGFPTGLRPVEVGDGPGASGDVSVSLPVTPAFVGVRARTDGAWRPGVPLVVDALMLLVLAGFLVVGRRHLREVVG